jgi:ABC-type multidrug transport system ATPase subunit/ABC-type multidrug transport system permease subunit
MVLYEGREVFFGRVNSAVEYFEQMGWHRPARQTAGDFLMAVTNPAQREAKTLFQDAVPRTAEDFEDHWRKSLQYALLQLEIDKYLQEVLPAGDAGLREFAQSRGALKAKCMFSRAAQTVSFPMQTRLCARRACQQLWNDKSSTTMAIIGEIFLALVVGSMFYGTPINTNAFFSYGSLLFFSVLLNVLMAMTDIHTMYKGRPVVRKQASYAFYRPSADALATVLVDLPVKFVLAIFFNVTLYFLAGLSATAAQFFTFFLVVFLATLAMSFLFRTIAASTDTLPQAMAICGFLVLAFVAYTGFVLPGPYMPPWFKWISFINPLSYAFEALLVNQAHGTNYPCTAIIPPYWNISVDAFTCAVPGAISGQTYVSGDDWFETAYGYSYSHLWRNIGILAGFLAFFLITYLLATEIHTSSASEPDVLVFLHDGPGTHSKAEQNPDIESGPAATTSIQPPTAGKKSASSPRTQEMFSWENVYLTVKIGGQPRQLLNCVSGWVHPGTLTALMGVSGAGKTTLLNALAHRLPSTTARGHFYIAGKPIPASFTSEIGYVQQQDVHLETSTVREALQFSAMLRQPKNVPKKEKLAFAEQIIGLLEMEDFAGAVIGIPGKGLNVEQRKRVSIGVELAANPKLLLFLDEPTSGLDGQSSMAIVALLRRLASNGLGILCTIHQPSAILFEEFDRVLLMASGGRTVYFGDIGRGSETVLRYFNNHGARKLLDTENPADYLLSVIQSADHIATPDKHDWPRLWSESGEAKEVSSMLAQMKDAGQQPREEGGNREIRPTTDGAWDSNLLLQIPVVCYRVIQFYWRSPTYVLSKYLLAILASLLIGFSFFQSDPSILGIQNAIFGVLMICATFSALVQQVRNPRARRRGLQR